MPQILAFKPVFHTHSAHIHLMLSKQSVPEHVVKALNKTLEKLKSNRALYKVINFFPFVSLPFDAFYRIEIVDIMVTPVMH